jgi:DNA transformation protein
MAVSQDYRAYILEQLSALPGVHSKRMFGGVGLYCEELFFALIDDDTLYLKVDDTNREAFVARDMQPFRPYRDKPEFSMSYYEVPAEAIEDSAELVAWAKRSIAVAIAHKKPMSRAKKTRRQ